MYLARVLKYLKQKLIRRKRQMAFVIGNFNTTPSKIETKADKRGQVRYRRFEQ